MLCVSVVLLMSPTQALPHSIPYGVSSGIAKVVVGEVEAGDGFVGRQCANKHCPTGVRYGVVCNVKGGNDSVDLKALRHGSGSAGTNTLVACRVVSCPFRFVCQCVSVGDHRMHACRKPAYLMAQVDMLLVQGIHEPRHSHGSYRSRSHTTAGACLCHSAAARQPKRSDGRVVLVCPSTL